MPMLCSSGVSAGLLLLVATLSTCLVTPIKAIFTLISHVTSCTSPSCFKAEADLTDSRKGIDTCQCWGCKAGDSEAGVSPLRGSEIRPGSAARRPGTSHYARPARPALHYTLSQRGAADTAAS